MFLIILVSYSEIIYASKVNFNDTGRKCV